FWSRPPDTTRYCSPMGKNIAHIIAKIFASHTTGKASANDRANGRARKGNRFQTKFFKHFDDMDMSNTTRTTPAKGYTDSGIGWLALIHAVFQTDFYDWAGP